MEVLSASNLTRVYRGQRGAVFVKALDNLSLSVRAGDFVAIMGPSGSGKTTLLNLLGTLDPPTTGEVRIEGELATAITGDALSDFRRRRLGFIFQDHNLLDFLTVRDNVVLPLALEGRPPAEIEAKLTPLIRALGIEGALERFPYEVSGGERQRAAAARALIHSPAFVLADEPTGSLDSRTARDLMAALCALNERHRATILMATHDPVSASYCSRVLFLRDGRLFTELRRGAERRQFYQQILDVQAVMGGERPDPRFPGH